MAGRVLHGLVVGVAVVMVAVMMAIFVAGGQVWGLDKGEKREVRELVREEVERLLTTEGALSKEARDAFDGLVEEAIARIIRERTAEAEEEAERQQREQLANMRPVDAKRDHIYGRLDAPVTLVEYSDFECPYCKQFHPTVIRLLENNAEQVRWVYRHFPLSFHNPGAQKQAEASECVAELKGNAAFWKFTHAIYARTEAGGNGFPLGNLRGLAEEVGVDGGAFTRCLDSGRMAERVYEDQADGVTVGVTATPIGFLLNEAGEVHRIVGATPLTQLQNMLDDLIQ